MGSDAAAGELTAQLASHLGVTHIERSNRGALGEAGSGWVELGSSNASVMTRFGCDIALAEWFDSMYGICTCVHLIRVRSCAVGWESRGCVALMDESMLGLGPDARPLEGGHGVLFLILMRPLPFRPPR